MIVKALDENEIQKKISENEFSKTLLADTSSRKLYNKQSQDMPKEKLKHQNVCVSPKAARKETFDNIRRACSQTTRDLGSCSVSFLECMLICKKNATPKIPITL